MTFEQACPRCGDEFVGDDKDSVADDVIAHARDAHGHHLDRDVVLAHLEGVHPPSETLMSSAGRLAAFASYRYRNITPALEEFHRENPWRVF